MELVQQAQEQVSTQTLEQELGRVQEWEQVSACLVGC